MGAPLSDAALAVAAKLRSALVLARARVARGDYLASAPSRPTLGLGLDACLQGLDESGRYLDTALIGGASAASVFSVFGGARESTRRVAGISAAAFAAHGHWVEALLRAAIQEGSAKNEDDLIALLADYAPYGAKYRGVTTGKREHRGQNNAVAVRKSLFGLLLVSILKSPALQGKVTEESLVIVGTHKDFYLAALNPACDDSVPGKLTRRLRHYIVFDELGLSKLVEREPYRNQDKTGAVGTHYSYGPRSEPHVFSLEKNPMLLYTMLKEIYITAG